MKVRRVIYGIVAGTSGVAAIGFAITNHPAQCALNAVTCVIFIAMCYLQRDHPDADL